MCGPEELRVRRSDFLATAMASVVSPGPRRSVLRLSAMPAGQDVDPYRDQRSRVDEIAWLFADGLVGWSRGPVPLLAAHLPEASDGGRRYRYRLRPARWHDGTTVTSADVVNAFNAVKRGYWQFDAPYRDVREVVPRSDRAFDVVLKYPNPGFVRSFFGAYGRPALPLLRSVPGGLPLGTGPFAVRARPDFNRWRLERSDGSPRGRARFDAIDLRYLYSAQTNIVTLLAKETDIALPLPSRYRDSNQFRRIRRTNGTTLLIFNAAGPFGAFTAREAFAKTVDVATVQRDYDPRRSSLLATFLLTGPNDDRFARALAHDSTAAGTLQRFLAGQAVRLITQQGTVETAMGSVRDRLVELGIEVQMLQTPFEELYGPLSPLRRGNFDIAVNSYPYADESDLAADWTCASRPPAGGNFARWCDAELDRAILAGDRKAAFRRLYDRIAAIPLSRGYEHIGVGPRACNVSAPPLLVPATYSCADWSSC
jgi:MarR-like DNA-binding transcriptional regulator SgrR of sgrS sRNA